MRDIRDDLRERVQEYEVEIALVEQRLNDLQNLRSHYVDMLEVEEQRWRTVNTAPNGTVQAHAPTEAGRERTPLSKFILEILDDGQSHSEKEITETAIARQFPFGTKTPWKVIHFGMTGWGETANSRDLALAYGENQWKLNRSGTA